MSEAREPRRRDEHGRLLPVEHPRDRRAALDAKAARERQRRAAAREAAGRGAVAEQDKRVISVSVRLWDRQPGVTFKLSQREAGALDHQADDRAVFTRDLLWQHGIGDTATLEARAAEAGSSRAAYVRGLLLEALGIEDRQQGKGQDR